MILKLLPIFALLCSTFAQLSPEFYSSIPTTSAAQKFTNLSEAIKDGQSFIEKLAIQSAMPSLVFGISVKGKTIWRHSQGYADVENELPTNLTTKYRLASISKTFTSALLGTMVERGLIRYDDPIHHYLKESDYPNKKWDHKPANITIGQLLSHTAGERFTDLKEFEDFYPADTCTKSLYKFKDVPLKYKPGTEHLYSNYGFQILGAVIESVTNRSYAEAMTEFLHGKLKLNSSYVWTKDLIVKNKARYYRGLDKDHPNVNVLTAVLDEELLTEGCSSAGGLMSTVDDMLRYGNLMLDSYYGRPHAVLAQKTLKNMWASKISLVKAPAKSPCGYGYGWAMCNENANKTAPDVKHRFFVTHNGGLVGTSTFLIVYPHEQIVTVAMSNKGQVQPVLSQMIFKLVENVHNLF